MRGAGVGATWLSTTAPPPQCLQYKSDQQIDLKKLEALNNLMFLGMAHGPDAAAGMLWLGAEDCAV